MTYVRRKTVVSRSYYEVTVRDNSIEGSITQKEWNEKQYVREQLPLWGMSLWHVEPEKLWSIIDGLSSKRRRRLMMWLKG